MKKTLLLTAMIGLIGASVAMAEHPTGPSCAGCTKAGGVCKVCTAKAEKKVVSCKGCGEVKGSAKCCKPAAKCAACGLHKGSPGCAAACKK